MTPLLFVSATMLVAGLATTTYAGLHAGGGILGRVFFGYEARLERRTTFLLAPYRGRDVARAQVLAVSACLVLVLATQRLLPAALAGLVAFVPPFVLWKRHLDRVSKLERQLDTWLLMLANALKATSSVGEAIASTATLVPKPFCEEIDLLVKELRLGIPLHRALAEMAARIGSSVVSGALMMIVVARQTGGDLSTTLERAASALREAARLEGVLRTKTAEGRSQVAVLSLVPFVLCIVIAWLDPAWFDPLITETHGRGILAACAISWTVAAVWAHQIVGTEL
jgi:tight adherence protein B